AVSMRVSDMSGIFGCGSRRNIAILDASKPGLLEMLANGGASPVTSRWSSATTWQGSHHRRASCSPLRASAANAGCAITAAVRQQPMSCKLKLATFMDHAPLFQPHILLSLFSATRFALDQRRRAAPALLMATFNVEAYR